MICVIGSKFLRSKVKGQDHVVAIMTVASDLVTEKSTLCYCIVNLLQSLSLQI